MPAQADGAKILVIDDDEDVLEMIRFLLEAKGYAVGTALDGRAGLDAVTASRPDLILLDLKMPVMDGATFATELRGRGDSTPIVVVTAADDPRKRAGEIRAADWLGKPFEPADLIAIVARHLPGL